jgi:hypothetical protein
MVEGNSNVRCSSIACLRHLSLKKWLQWGLAKRNMFIPHDLQFSKLPLILMIVNHKG